MSLLLVLDEITGFYAIDGEQARLPQLKVEIDFTNDPTNPVRVWTDVTLDLRGLSYVRGGRNNELQRTNAGRLAAVFDNRAGKYDPTNATGPYYPGVKRTRWIRVRTWWAGTIYPRWQGLIDSWKQEWPAAGMDAVCTVEATDAFKALNLFDLTGLSFAAQRSDIRVSSVLAAAMVPAAAPPVGSSVLVASGTFTDGSSALEHLLQVEETENGLLFANEQGQVEFQDRHYRLTNSQTPVATIGDTGGEIPYRAAEHDLDDPDLWNTVGVTPSGGSAQVATDTTSKNAHFERRLNRASLSSDTADAAAAAAYLLGLYKESSPRIPEVELVGSADTSKWPVILAARNSQRFTFKRRAAANTITQDVYVEQVSDTITLQPLDWSVKLELSPVPATLPGWRLGDATNGKLGTTTALIY